MPYRTIEARKLTPHIGAEIGGIDLTQPLSDQQAEDLHAALMENLVTVTGRHYVFVNRTFTTRITQLTKAESDAVLEMLYRQVETPEFQCRFTWRPGSLAFWDNRCVQHQAVWDYFPERRYGHRITVKGERPRA